jgi:hypothetical protein
MEKIEAQEVAEIITREAKLVRTPMQDPMERRAICLKLAIDTGTVGFALNGRAGAEELAATIVLAARVYEGYIIEIPEEG